MVKQLIAIVALSIAVILSMSYAHQAVQMLLNAHEWVSQVLADVFSVGQAGNLVKGLLALLTIPIFVSLVPAVLYWIARRHWFPYFMEMVWVIWLVQIGAIVIMYKVV